MRIIDPRYAKHVLYCIRNPTSFTLKTTSSKFNQLGILRPPMPWHKPRVREQDADAVILLHGLWRSVWAMEPMAKHLNDHGFHTINVPYPSFRKPMAELTKIIHNAVKLHGGDRKVHFVAHSLGGVLVRKLLDQLPSDQVGRVVMLAPPNQGSEIVDLLSRYRAMRLSLGPAGLELGSDKIGASCLPEEIDCAVIMGKRSFFPLFRRLLDDENDGFVSVERGKIDGMNEFHVLDADHTFIASDPRVMKMTHEFIQDGPTN